MAPEAAVVPPVAPDQAQPEPSAEGARTDSGNLPPGAAGPKSTAALPSATELLARARHRLASGDARAALADLDAVLAAGGSRGQQAEAYMLKGDCALVQGDSKAAVRQYLDVSRRFSGLRAAETALFAAARVESNSGNKAAAKKLLLAYSERYPNGQFKSEVGARLRIIEAQ